MHKKILLYVLVVIVLFALPIYTIVVSMDTLKGGNEFLFKVQAFDPYDMFRGNYININFQERYADSSNIENGVSGKKYFVTIETDDEGYAYFSDVSIKRPDDTADDYETEAYFFNYNDDTKGRSETPERY